jgi:phage-related protein
MEQRTIKPLSWIGSSKSDLQDFPESVKDLMGFALYLAQTGGKHPVAKPLKGFGGAGVLEVVDDHHGDTYRAVYTFVSAMKSMCCMLFRRSQKAV